MASPTHDTCPSMPKVSTFRTLAPKLVKNGWVPIPAKGKAPYIKTWLNKTPESLVLLRKSQHYANCNVGIRTGESIQDGWMLAGLDFDVDCPEFVDKVKAEAIALQATAPVRHGRPGRCLLPVAVPSDVHSTSIKLMAPNGEKRSVDVLAGGRMFIAYGIHPDTGGTYTWKGSAPDTMTPLDLPHIGDIAEFIRACLPTGWQMLHHTSVQNVAVIEQPTMPIDETIKSDLHEALTCIPSDDRDTWQRMGHALKTLGEAGRNLWLEWSSTSIKYDAHEAQRVWNSLHPTRTDYRAVFAEAIRLGWRSQGKPQPHIASEPPAQCYPAASSPPAKGRLVVADWASMQHYRDRNPPWIKVYRALLDDMRFHRLDLSAQACLLPVMLLASETREGYVPSDIAVIAFRLRKPESEITRAIEQLIQAGYLVREHNC